MTPEYKAEKEASVSFLGGGGIWEINYVTVVAPAAALLWAILQSRQSFFKPYTIPAAVADFLLHCCAILFATTIYSSAPHILDGLLLLPAVATLLQPSVEPKKEVKRASKTGANGQPTAPENGQATDSSLDSLPIKPFITTYRGAMMIITCTSILAVDFRVFPRRFVKTESFGTSLMDMGVGSFVFAAGLVAARQQLKEQQSQAPSFIAQFIAAIRHSLPLLALGLARLWTVKSLEYAEHVSEYGVHWNFFFTLALLPPMTALVHPVLRFIPSYGGLAFFFAVCYEIALYMTPDLKRYIILSERRQGDWLSQNREGVFSLIGYFAIFIAGMGTGMHIFPRDEDPRQPQQKDKAGKDSMDEDAEWLASVMSQSDDQGSSSSMEVPQLKPELPKTTLVFLTKWTILWFVFAVWAMWKYGPRLLASRRMANLAYICWVCAFNTAQLLLFCVVEKIMFPDLYAAKDRETERQRIKDATSSVMHAFNRNGLAIFLLANLLTGAINMTLPTIHMGEIEAMTVLVAYIAVICGFALALDHYDISIKL